MGTGESALQSLIRRAARVYTAGPAIQDAQAACEKLARNGIASTVCYWDLYADQPVSVTQAYVEVLRASSKVASDCYLSVKAPALKFDIDLVSNVLAEARKLNAIVHFDSMGPETADRTFAVIEQASKMYPNLGCTLPGRWRRSLRDAERALELGLRIRVVKGEWPGIGDDETDPREGFLNVIDMMAGRAVHVAVATHNPAIARFSLRRLKNASTPCELELLYGLPQQPLLKIARDFGVRTRMYVPHGHVGLPYRLKNVIRNPRIVGWFLHDLWRAR
jgi:proline dehydrogenase